MGIRESIKDKPKALPITAAVVMVTIAIVIVQAMRSGSSTPTATAYFTTDDGATQFEDSMEHLAPFEHDGKQAYRVWMFSRDGGKTKFPGFLERYTPTAKARIESEMKDFKSGKRHMPPDVSPADCEVKKAGAANPWVSRADSFEAQKVIRSNSNSDAQLVLPD